MISEAICVRNRTKYKAVVLVEACIESVVTANKGFSYLVYCFSFQVQKFLNQDSFTCHDDSNFLVLGELSL